MPNESPPPSILEFLKHHAPFQQMEGAHLEYMVSRLELRFYPQEAVILSPGSGKASRFFIIKQGRVQGLERNSATERVHIAWELVTGECFPVGALLDSRPVALDYVAVEETFCLELPREGFDFLLNSSPVFLEFCMRRLSSLLRMSLQETRNSVVSQIAEEVPLNSVLSSFIRKGPFSCVAETPLEEAFTTMTHENVGSIVVVEGERPVGILTLRDVLPRVVLPGRSLNTPVREVMTPNPLSLSPDDTAYEAALVMAERGVAHLCLVDQGKLVGVISERDLFSLQRIGLVQLTRSIVTASDVERLAKTAEQVAPLIDQMLAQGISVGHLIRIITTLNDHITRRAVMLCVEQEPPGLPEFTWLAFGSEGRREQTLRTDQDNGMLFLPPQGHSAEEVRMRLLPLARRINQALADCGFPLCTGNVMASNPECCLSLEEWQQRYGRWMAQGTPEHLLNASIYFDFRPLYGPLETPTQLWNWLAVRIPKNMRFLRQMAENAMRLRPPLGMWRDFEVSRGGAHPHTFDLKLQGITPFVDSARIMALANGIMETNTLNRLRRMAKMNLLTAPQVEAWCDAMEFIQLMRMRLHRGQALRGEPLDNHMNPDTLNELDRRLLKEVFRQGRRLQDRLALDYQL